MLLEISQYIQLILRQEIETNQATNFKCIIWENIKNDSENWLGLVAWQHLIYIFCTWNVKCKQDGIIDRFCRFREAWKMEKSLRCIFLVLLDGNQSEIIASAIICMTLRLVFTAPLWTWTERFAYTQCISAEHKNYLKLTKTSDSSLKAYLVHQWYCSYVLFCMDRLTPDTISSPPRFWTSALTLLQMLSWWQYRAILCR